MWENTKPIRKFWEECREKGLSYSEAAKKLKKLDYQIAPYGDWTLFRDDTGNLWEEYFNIGD